MLIFICFQPVKTKHLSTPNSFVSPRGVWFRQVLLYIWVDNIRMNVTWNQFYWSIRCLCNMKYHYRSTCIVSHSLPSMKKDDHHMVVLLSNSPGRSIGIYIHVHVCTWQTLFICSFIIYLIFCNLFFFYFF